MTTVYLAGPINGASDDEAKLWRKWFKLKLNGRAEVLDPMSRDYRGVEDMNVSEIVEGDKRDIALSDVFVAYCPKPSVGTSMEVLWAHMLSKRVVVIVPTGVPVSPWLAYHATVVVAELWQALEQVLLAFV